MLSQLAGLLLFQIALVSPNAGLSGGDLLPAELGEWRASPGGSVLEKFSAAQVNTFAAGAIQAQSASRSAGADSAALNEFGFFGAQRRTYQHGHKTITVEAIRMKDSSAAYGAYTWYRQAGWREEFSVPHDPRSFQASVGPNEAVLQRNSYCLRILGAPPSHKELALAAAVLPSMQDEPMPSLAEYLPAAGMVHSSAKYAYGPQVFEHVVSQLPAMAVGFHMGAEAVAAEYHLPGKQPMTLVLVEYPTPQIARNFAKNLGAKNLGAKNLGAKNLGAKNLGSLNPASVRIRRKGPLLMIVPDAVVETDAEHLMDQVHYAMDGMWDEKVSSHKEPTFAQMIMSIFELCGILLVFCALSGVAYGGILALTRRKNPGYGFEGDAGFTSLNING
jgi:hypothetical protein